MYKLVYVGHFLATAIGVIAILRLMGNRPFPKWTLLLIAAGLAIFEAASVWVTFPTNPYFWDFLQCYYPAGEAALHHDTAMLRTLYEKVVQGFVNMPVVAYLFAPFALLAPRTASILYTVVGIALTVWAWVLLARLARLERRERWLLALLFLANGPLINGLKFGNTSHIILFALVAGLVLLRERRSALAGLLLGAAAVLKPALLLFGVFFVLRRDVRGTLGFAAAGIVIGALSLVLFGWAFNVFWFETSILQFSHQWFSTFSVQSIPGFILRLRADPDILTSWRPLIPAPGEKLAAQILVGLLYVFASAACIKALLPRAGDASRSMGDPGVRRDLQYLLVVCLAVISSPLSWSHYYVWLLMPAAFFLGSAQLSSQTQVMRWLPWLAIALVTPLVVWPWSFSNPALAMLYRSFAASNLLYGGLLWFGLVAWWLARSNESASTARP